MRSSTDYDLYVLAPAYFENIYCTLTEEELDVCGRDLSWFGGLCESRQYIRKLGARSRHEMAQKLVQTDKLFSRGASFFGDRRIDFDPFCWVQSRTERRAQARNFSEDDCIHFFNMIGRIRGGYPASMPLQNTAYTF